MSNISFTNNQGTTISFSTGTILSDTLKGAKTATAGAVDQVVQAGIAFKDAVGNAIAPTVNQMKDLASAAATYCNGVVTGVSAQVTQLVNDAVKYCQARGIKGKSTLDQVALYLKENGPTMTVTPAPAATVGAVGTVGTDVFMMDDTRSV
jgi:phage-related minor tail protein